jgi:hypothetical protein
VTSICFFPIRDKSAISGVSVWRPPRRWDKRKFGRKLSEVDPARQARGRDDHHDPRKVIELPACVEAVRSGVRILACLSKLFEEHI